MVSLGLGSVRVVYTIRVLVRVNTTQNLNPNHLL